MTRMRDTTIFKLLCFVFYLSLGSIIIKTNNPFPESTSTTREFADVKTIGFNKQTKIFHTAQVRILFESYQDTAATIRMAHL